MNRLAAAAVVFTLSICSFAMAAPTGLVGDINADYYVNVGDLQLLVAAWGGGPGFAGPEDINRDGYVNVGDLQLLVAHWGESGAPGTGLLGEYFNDTGGTKFTTLVRVRADPTVNFDWAIWSPDSAVQGDFFSVRWTGQVLAQYTETYTFYTISDDGARLWVNGQQLVNNWTPHGTTENSGTIALSAGVKYDIKMEYYENGGGAVARLLWSSASTTKQVIPKVQLYPAVDPNADTTAPAAITNLVTSNPTSSNITLSWTAPGDNGSTGFAAIYDIRYRTDGAVNDTNWATATQISGEPVPAAPGTNQTMTITGLSASTTYYFAIKTSDEVPNTSLISNSPNGTTNAADLTAPAAIADLVADNPTTNTITLTWTALGDDASTGTATNYDIRYRTGSPIDSTNWATATQLSTEPVPAVAGTSQTLIVGGLPAGFTYYFAIKTSDEVPNTSTISNSPSATTLPGTANNKPILGPRDFQYKGYYKLEQNSNLQAVGEARGLTHRYVSGQLRFLTMTNYNSVLPPTWRLIEVAPPAAGLGGTITTKTNYWDNIFAGTGLAYGVGIYFGLWYEQARDRLWTTWAIDYNTVNMTKSLAIRTLNSDGTISSVAGPWGLQGINQRRVYGGVQPIPAWFQTTYGVGPYATGWGGYASAMSYGVSLGPTFYTIPEPTGYPAGEDAIPTSAFKTLMDHSTSTLGACWYPAFSQPTVLDRGVRNCDVYNDFDYGSWLSPAPDGLGRQLMGDSNNQTGCWIETPNKQGFILIPLLYSGRAWYWDSRLWCQRRTADIQVYDPHTLGEVALGTRPVWNCKPTASRQITDDFRPLGCGWNDAQSGPMAATYDSTTQTLYVLSVGGTGGSYILVYDVDVQQASVDDVAYSDTAVTGTVGTTVPPGPTNCAITGTNDSVYQTIREVVQGNTSQLEHKWTFNVTSGSSVEFRIKAYKTGNSEGDDFVFAYSTNGTDWTNMVTVSRTTDDGTFQTCTLPAGTSGTVYVRVQDTDRTVGANNLDTIYIDEMMFRNNP